MGSQTAVKEVRSSETVNRSSPSQGAPRLIGGDSSESRERLWISTVEHETLILSIPYAGQSALCYVAIATSGFRVL